MRNMKRYLHVILILSSFAAYGQESEITEVPVFAFDQRVLGDRVLNINLGTNLPLFFQDLSGNTSPANLSLGGLLGLDLEFYLNNNVRIGGTLRGTFSGTPNANLLFLVPILFRGTYEFKLWPFSFPVTLGAGINFSAFKEALQVDFAAQIGGAAYYNVSSQWGFGLNVFYLWVPQIYGASSSYTIKESDSRFGNFLEISLGASFHF